MLTQDAQISSWPIPGALPLHPPHMANSEGGDPSATCLSSLRPSPDFLTAPLGAELCAEVKNHVAVAVDPVYDDREAPGYSELRAGHWSMFRHLAWRTRQAVSLQT
jgi:hypothetical protein